MKGRTIIAIALMLLTGVSNYVSGGPPTGRDSLAKGESRINSCSPEEIFFENFEPGNVLGNNTEIQAGGYPEYPYTYNNSGIGYHININNVRSNTWAGLNISNCGNSPDNNEFSGHGYGINGFIPGAYVNGPTPYSALTFNGFSLVKGTYELTFWLSSSNNTGSNNECSVYPLLVGQGYTRGSPIPPIINTCNNGCSPSPNNSCGALMRYRFEVNSDSPLNSLLFLVESNGTPPPGANNYNFILDAVRFTRISKPAPIVSAPTCGSNTVTVSVTNSTSGTYRWYQESTPSNPNPIQLTQSSTSSITLQNVASGSVFSVQEISDPGCYSPKTTFSYVAPVAPIVDVPVCNTSTVNVTVSNSTSGTYRWYQGSGAGRVRLSQFSASSITLQNVAPGSIYSVEAVSSPGNCVSPATAFTPYINPIPTTPPQVDNAYRCGNGLVTLTVNSPATGVTYEWFLVNGTGQTLVSPITGINSSFTFNATQNATYKVRAKGNSNCPPGPEQTVQVTLFRVNPTISLAAASGNSPYYRDLALTFSASASTSGSNSQYQWDWGDQSTTSASSSATATHAYTKAGIYNVSLLVTQTFVINGTAPTTRVCSETVTIPIAIREPLCELVVPVPGGTSSGTISKDLVTGAIEYSYGSNLACVPNTLLECLGEQPAVVPNVVVASATAFADTLVHDEPDYQVGTYASNPFLEGKRRMSPYATYTYNAPLKTTTANLNYETGTFSLAGFSWRSSARARPASWLYAAMADNVSPDGEILQEHDPLKVSSVAKFGYGSALVPLANNQSASASGHSLPYLVAHNASYQTVMFESFENLYGSAPNYFGEDRFALDNTEVDFTAYTGSTTWRHTGQNAARLKLKGAQYQLSLPLLPMMAQVQQTGLLVKCWVHQTLQDCQGRVDLIDMAEDMTVRSTAPLSIVAQNGEWTLVVASISLPSGLVAGYPLMPQLIFTEASSTAAPAPEVWVDDVRVQPGDAQMTTYVYDPQTFRVMASFDDQHFGALYQYNDEGKLIRKLVETERGVKLVQEVQYHTPQP